MPSPGDIQRFALDTVAESAPDTIVLDWGTGPEKHHLKLTNTFREWRLALRQHAIERGLDSDAYEAEFIEMLEVGSRMTIRQS